MSSQSGDFTVPVVAGDQRYEEKAGRPVGVSILAILHLIRGVLLFGMQVLLLLNLDAIENPLRSVGIPPALLVVGVMFLAMLTMASGTGMWKGAKWGWWLAAFYYVYSIFQNGSALLLIATMDPAVFEGASREPEFYLAKHGGRIVLHCLLFLYFFKGNVLWYFGLLELNKFKAVGALVGLGLTLGGLFSAASLLMR